MECPLCKYELEEKTEYEYGESMDDLAHEFTSYKCPNCHIEFANEGGVMKFDDCCDMCGEPLRGRAVTSSEIDGYYCSEECLRKAEGLP